MGFNTVRASRTLGFDPIDVPAFQVDPNFVLLGFGLLALAWFTGGALTRVQSYARRIRRR